MLLLLGLAAATGPWTGTAYAQDDDAPDVDDPSDDAEDDARSPAPSTGAQNEDGATNIEAFRRTKGPCPVARFEVVDPAVGKQELPEGSGLVRDHQTKLVWTRYAMADGPYETAAKVCKQKGMRLPTLSEAVAITPANSCGWPDGWQTFTSGPGATRGHIDQNGDQSASESRTNVTFRSLCVQSDAQIPKLLERQRAEDARREAERRKQQALAARREREEEARQEAARRKEEAREAARRRAEEAREAAEARKRPKREQRRDSARQCQPKDRWQTFDGHTANVEVIYTDAGGIEIWCQDYSGKGCVENAMNRRGSFPGHELYGMAAACCCQIMSD